MKRRVGLHKPHAVGIMSDGGGDRVKQTMKRDDSLKWTALWHVALSWRFGRWLAAIIIIVQLREERHTHKKEWWKTLNVVVWGVVCLFHHHVDDVYLCVSTAAAKKLRLLFKYIKRRAQSSHRHPEPDQRCMESASYPAAPFCSFHSIFFWLLLQWFWSRGNSTATKKKTIDLIQKAELAPFNLASR